MIYLNDENQNIHRANVGIDTMEFSMMYSQL